MQMSLFSTADMTYKPRRATSALAGRIFNLWGETYRYLKQNRDGHVLARTDRAHVFVILPPRRFEELMD